MANITKEELFEIIDKQFEINWYEMKAEMLSDIENWYNIYTTTKENEDIYRKYLTKVFKKKLKLSWGILAEVVNNFIFLYWLRIDEEKKSEENTEADNWLI